MGKLTKAQRSELERAVDHPAGVVDTPHGAHGLARASFHAKMSRMVADGLFTRYRHGGYEITQAGMDALAQAGARV